MSISITLVRDPGQILADGSLGEKCRVAPSITDASLPSERIALIRAGAELDIQGVQRIPISGQIPAPGHLQPGTIGRIVDSERGAVAAKLTAITYTLSLSDDGRTFTADASITMDRLDA